MELDIYFVTVSILTLEFSQDLFGVHQFIILTIKIFISTIGRPKISKKYPFTLVVVNLFVSLKE